MGDMRCPKRACILDKVGGGVPGCQAVELGCIAACIATDDQDQVTALTTKFEGGILAILGGVAESFGDDNSAAVAFYGGGDNCSHCLGVFVQHGGLVSDCQALGIQLLRIPHHIPGVVREALGATVDGVDPFFRSSRIRDQDGGVVAGRGPGHGSACLGVIWLSMKQDRLPVSGRMTHKIPSSLNIAAGGVNDVAFAGAESAHSCIHVEGQPKGGEN